VNLTVLVHNNRVYGLTSGQAAPTSPREYHGKSNPYDNGEIAFNPPELLLSAGCSFIARGYTRQHEELKGLIYDGVTHSGFSFIDILQICASFMDKTEEYDRQVYVPDLYGPEDFDAACRLVREYSYGNSGKIPVGVIFRAKREQFNIGTPAREQEYADKRSFVQRFIDGRR